MTQLQDQLAQATDVIRREQLFDLLQEARKVKPPTIDYARELELETEIRELQRDEVLRNEERRLTAYIINTAFRQGRLNVADRAPEWKCGTSVTGLMVSGRG